MVRVYGASDDLVEIEGSTYKEDEIGCYNSNVKINFVDGTEILVSYPKKDAAIWEIKVLHKGTAACTLTICDDEEAEIYSDIFEIDAEIQSHTVIR